jgi:hypothetical protein
MEGTVLKHPNVGKAMVCAISVSPTLSQFMESDIDSKKFAEILVPVCWLGWVPMLILS